VIVPSQEKVHVALCKCGEEVEDIFELCWNCQASRSGRSMAPFDSDARQKQIEPQRLRTKIQANGLPALQRQNRPRRDREFHEGANHGVLGDLEGLFVGRDQLDMYHCPECGHVEFFAFGE